MNFLEERILSDGTIMQGNVLTKMGFSRTYLYCE